MNKDIVSDQKLHHPSRKKTRTRMPERMTWILADWDCQRTTCNVLQMKTILHIQPTNAWFEII